MKKFCNSKNPIKVSAASAHFKRGLALAVAASVAFTSADFTSMAVSDAAEIDPIEIASFDDLSADIAYQQLSVGASESDIVFPNTLKAIRSNEEDNFIEETGDEEVIDYTDESQEEVGDNSGESENTDSQIIETPVEETPAENTEESSDEEITVEEDNTVARILGSFFLNLFGDYTTTAYAAESDEINITNVEWTLSGDLSDKAEFEADEQWLRYTYVPEIPSCYVTDAELPKITVDIIGTEVEDEIRQGDDENIELLQDEDYDSDDETADFEEAEVDEIAKEGEYSYISKAEETKLITEILQEALTSGGSTPILEPTDLDKVEVTEVTAEDGTSDLFEIKKYTKSGEDLIEDSINGAYGIHVKKAFNEEKKVTVKLKEKVEASTDPTNPPAEPKTYTFIIKITADAPETEVIEITVADKYTYNRKEQTLNQADVTVTKGTEKTPIPAEDYDIEEIKQTNAGKYSFRVTFKNNSAALVQKTGVWEIKPVEVKLVADDKASAINGKAATASYKVVCINEKDAENFKDVHTDELGITPTFTSTTLDLTKSGVYDIVNSYNTTETDPNYSIKSEQNVNEAKYYVVGPLKLQVKVGTKTYESSFTISKGTSYYSAMATQKSTYIATKASFKFIYKDSAGNIVAQVGSKVTQGIPSEIGKYSVSAEYKITEISTADQTVKIALSGNDTATTAEIPYEIVESQKEITKSNVTFKNTSFTYNAKEHGPTVTVTYDGVKLEEGKDYELTGDVKEEDANDDYEITVVGKGEYSGSVSKSWVIKPANISSATIPSSTKISYSYTGSEISHTVPSSITLSGMTLRVDEEYELDESRSTVKATKAGTYTVYLTAYDDNFTGTKSYTWKITSSSSSTTTGKVTATVNFSNPDNVTSGITTANSSKFEAYANSKKTSGKTIDFTLRIKPVNKSNLNSAELNAIGEFGDSSVISTDTVDVTVHKVVKNAEGNTESEEDVSDLGGSIDVVCYIGTTNAAKTINLIREHGGEIKKFSKLSSRPSSSYSDGTFYVDKSNGRVYIYSRYFSRFTLIYTDTDTVVKNTRTSSGTATASDDPEALGARAPQTGDNLPVVWVWVIVLLAGVSLIGFSAFELKKFKRGDFKKKR